MAINACLFGDELPTVKYMTAAEVNQFARVDQLSIIYLSKSAVLGCLPSNMVYVELLDDFEKMAERIYLNSPMKTRCAMKYDHSNTCLKVKVTDDRSCVQYKTDSQQELRKLEKLISNMMKHMASGER